MHTTIPTIVGFAKAPCNKGRPIGQKHPLNPKEVWAIRVRLQLEGRKRDLALFNLAIDSKLRGCDLVSVQVEDVCTGGRVRDRGTVIQKKTGRPVQFEITEQTRSSIRDWLSEVDLSSGAIFSRVAFERSRTFRPVNTRASCIPGSRAPSSIARPTAPTRCAGRRRPRSIEKPESGPAIARPYEGGKHRPLPRDRGRRRSQHRRAGRTLIDCRGPTARVGPHSRYSARIAGAPAELRGYGIVR